MPTTLTIAVDAMSGDHGARVTVPAAIDVLADNQDLRLLLVGRAGDLEPLLRGGAAGGRCEIVEASEVVGMDERPKDAVRKKKNSSMRVAVNRRDGRAAACVSAGNTGALLARPVSCSAWCRSRPSAIVSSDSIRERPHGHAGPRCESRLHGTAPRRVRADGQRAGADLHGVDGRVGLLNIGEEDIKGTGAA
jgi:glycerol-3-phosphate acyltransferase PlsX